MDSASVGTQCEQPQPLLYPKEEWNGKIILDFRNLNKCLVRRPYLIPKIADIIQKLEGIYYAISLDLNVGYYTVQLGQDSQKLQTIIRLWGKYQYL